MWREPKEGYNKDGKARYCERVKDPLTEKYIVKSQVIEKDTPSGRKEAIFKLNKKIEKVLYSESKVKSLTFFEICDLFLDYNKKRIFTSKIDTKEHKGTITKQRFYTLSSGVNSLKSKIKDFKASSLNALVYNNVLNSKNFKNGNHTVFNQIINFAYKQELINSKSFTLPVLNKNENINEKYLEHFEIQELFEQIKNDVILYNIVFIFLETGIRVGELIALEKTDVNYEDMSLTINKTYSFEFKSILKNTKNKKSRVIGINKECCKKFKFFENLSNSEYLFYLKNKHISAKQINVKLYKIKLSSNKHLHNHIFRHTHASLLAEKLIPLEVISRRLGDNSETIKNIYLHTTEKIKKNEIELFNNISILE